MILYFKSLKLENKKKLGNQMIFLQTSLQTILMNHYFNTNFTLWNDLSKSTSRKKLSCYLKSG